MFLRTKRQALACALVSGLMVGGGAVGAAAAPLDATPTPDTTDSTVVGIPLSAPLSLEDAVDLGGEQAQDVVGYRYDNGVVVGEFFPGTVTVDAFLATFESTYGTQPAVTDLVALEPSDSEPEPAREGATRAMKVASVRLDTHRAAFKPVKVSSSKLRRLFTRDETSGVAHATKSSMSRGLMAAAATGGHASWSPDIVAVRVWRSGAHQYIRNNIAWDSTSNNNTPSGWGMEVGVDLLRTVDGAEADKYGERGAVWPKKICEVGFRDKFVAKNYDFNSWSATSTEGKVGAGKPYADYNDLDDSCYRNSMTIGFQKPGLIPGNRLVTEIDAQKASTSSSYVGAGVQLVHDDCGSRPSAVALTDCMGTNPLFFNPPASYHSPRPVLNSARGWKAAPELCWRSSDYGTGGAPVQITCP